MGLNNKKIIILSGIILSIGLTSCQVTNKYKKPEIDSEKLFRNTSLNDTTSIANTPWNEFFKDRILQGYIENGLMNNFDMLIAIERIKQAEAELGQARAAYFPDVVINGQFTQKRHSSRDPLTGTPQTKNNLAYHTENYTLGVGASWELDIFGKLNRQSRAKYAKMLNSHAGKNLVQTSLISNIVNTYYSLLALDKQLEFTNEMINLMSENLKMTEALKNGGFVNGAAVEQTRAALFNLKTTVPDLENNITALENTLCTILARKSGKIERTSLNNQEVSQMLDYGIPMQRLSRRPDVLQAELSFRTAFELTNVAKANFYPSITLTSASVGFGTTNGLSNFFKPENLLANIMGGITQPLFARKRLITQYNIAKSEQKMTLIRFEQTVLAAGQEVSTIVNTYESSLRKNADRDGQVTSLLKAVDYTNQLFKSGEASYLEVLSAQQNLLQAQLKQVNDKLQQLQASSDLYRALGGGTN